MPIGERLFVILVLIAVPLLLIGLPIYLLMGGLHAFARKPLERCFSGIEWRVVPELGDVKFEYHTYRGFLLWWTQTEHQVAAPPNEARRLLKRLLRFNLTWGLLTGMILILPFLAVGNYYAQLRAIARQEQDLAHA